MGADGIEPCGGEGQWRAGIGDERPDPATGTDRFGLGPNLAKAVQERLISQLAWTRSGLHPSTDTESGGWSRRRRKHDWLLHFCSSGRRTVHECAQQIGWE